ncbi:hypothetical protein [Streptomyces sp. NK15101]|uniref:hypothetical protein n=1 Tax=Streptomyces sp. NK15101 TaxID=2873261 RepID=UPI001CECB026|nr:hypothetical protein [Streptomyces sp. NK15101]
MRTALRTALATALVAGVVATPVLAAGSAFATGTAPVPVEKPAEQPVEKSVEKPAAAAAAPSPSASAPAAAPATADPAKGTLVRTQTLVTGTVAKIYKVSALHHRAELFWQGNPVGVLDANTRSTAGQNNGEFLVLNPDGTTHNWTGNTAPGTPGVYRLADGTLVQLAKKDGRFGLQVIENGTGRGYTYVTGVRSVWTFGKAVVVLEQNGSFSAYVPGAARQAAPQPVATDGYVRTEKLEGGGEAKIFKVSAGHHRAELYQQGKHVGTLDADHWSVAANNNGAFFVLNSDGSSHDWVGNYLPGAKPGQYKLANGVRLEIVHKDGRWGLQEIRLGHGTGVSYLKGDRQVFHLTGGGLVVLERDGGLAAYIPGSSRQSAPMPFTRDDECTVITTVSIGAGTEAELTMSPNGPTATFHDAGDDKQVFSKLDRKHPSLPTSAGIIARIDNPFSATPTLYTKVEGGVGSKGGSHAFPKMPKGCTLNPVTGGTTVPTGNNGSNGSTGTTGGQTSVVPQGGVAAGAELGTTETDSTALYATGAGAASLAAAGLGFVVLRRRAGARG